VNSTSKIHRIPQYAVFSTPPYSCSLGPNINLNIHFSNFLNVNISDQFYSRTNQQQTLQFSVSWSLFLRKANCKTKYSAPYDSKHSTNPICYFTAHCRAYSQVSYHGNI